VCTATGPLPEQTTSFAGNDGQRAQEHRGLSNITDANEEGRLTTRMVRRPIFLQQRSDGIDSRAAHGVNGPAGGGMNGLRFGGT
jgi:hypothetical protein